MFSLSLSTKKNFHEFYESRAARKERDNSAKSEGPNLITRRRKMRIEGSDWGYREWVFRRDNDQATTVTMIGDVE